MKAFYRKHKRALVFGACFALLIYYFIWSISKPYDYAPDEYHRFPICYYLFNHGALPSGWLPDTRNELWGFSYAFYITWLPYILSSLCMKVMSFFTMSGKAILVAARFPSVVASSITAFFVFKSLDKLLYSERIKWLIFITISTTPQFAFLASYVNCDALALLGSAIICYSWIYIFKERLNIRISVLLAIGISIVTLSYYNAYGWILLSIILFITRALPSKKEANLKNRKEIWICGLVVTIIVLGLCGYFPVRNALIYNGDILGITSLKQSSEMYAIDTLKPSLRQTPYSSGVSFWEMVSTTDWIESTVKSCIGYFGYMMFECPGWLYNVYASVDIGGYVFFIAETLILNTKKKKVQNTDIYFRFLLILAAAIPVCLSLHYSFYTDYQPQGRYIYPALPAAAVFLGFGYDYFYKLLKDKIKISLKILNILIIILTIGMIAVSLYAFKEVYLRSSWGSMEFFLYSYPIFN